MKIIHSAPLLAALAAASASLAQTGTPPKSAPPVVSPVAPVVSPQPAAPTEAAELVVHDLRPAFVPLVAQPLDTSQASDPIWVTGDRPAKNVIAKLVLRPIDTVVVEQDAGQGAGKKLVLLRAIAGDPTRFITKLAIGSGAQRIYCADGATPGDAGPISCFEDRDGDGAFENRIFGLGESGAKAGQLSILAKPLPLPAPLRYRPAAAGEVPEYNVIVANCGKDHDRPLYSVRLGDGGDGIDITSALAAMSSSPRSMAELNAAFGGLSGNCQSAVRVREGEPLHPGTVAKGGAVARLGELVIAIGPKEEGASVRLLGLREPDRLYRLSYSNVVPVSETPTARQKALALEQKFDRPVLGASGVAEVSEGRRAVGDDVATVGLKHGYMGVLTQDTVIRTLFSKRSLPKGTVLYGVPMSSRVERSYGGIPLPSANPGIPEADEVALVWCVPVQDGEEWSATCLPHQGAVGRYTLLKGQRPAFEVTGMRYAAGTASNEGEVPVEAREGDFGKPLAYRFRIKSVSASAIVLTQDTMFGDSVVNSKEVRIPRMAGRVSGLSFGGGMITFAAVDGADDAVMVKQVRPVRTGAAARAEYGILTPSASGASPALPPAPAEPSEPSPPPAG
jgi:hypothetical protein